MSLRLPGRQPTLILAVTPSPNTKLLLALYNSSHTVLNIPRLCASWRLLLPGAPVGEGPQPGAVKIRLASNPLTIFVLKDSF